MVYRDHARTVGGALANWWRATTLDALLVGVVWFIGLELIGVAWAPFWALVAALMQFIPNFGGPIALCGPAVAIAFSGHDFDRLLWLLGLYAVIVILDGLVIQPMILKRTNRIPWWASLFGPIVLGIAIPFWGVLLAPPLLAIVFAFVPRKPDQPMR